VDMNRAAEICLFRASMASLTALNDQPPCGKLQVIMGMVCVEPRWAHLDDTGLRATSTPA
jgi:hypothetical protein